MRLRISHRTRKRLRKCHVQGRGAVTPNDPKLSDCGARRAGCGVSDKADARGRERVSRRRRVEREKAASVTRGAVRCSAWLGVTWTRRRRCKRVWKALGLAKDLRTSCRPWSGAGEKRGTRFGWLRIGWVLTNNGQKARRCVPGTGARCGNENGETQDRSSNSEQTSER